MQTRILGFLFLNLILLPLGASAQTEEPTHVSVMGFESSEEDANFASLISVSVHSAVRIYDDWRAWEGIPNLGFYARQYGCAETMPTSSLQCLGRIAGGRNELLITGNVQRTSATDDYDYTVSVDLVSAEDGGTIVSSVNERFEGHRMTPENMSELANRIVRGLREEADLPVSSELATVPDVLFEDVPAPGRRGLDWIAPLGWTLLAAGAATFGGLVGVWVRLNDLNNDPAYNAYRAMTPQNVYLCGDGAPAFALSICNEGSSLEVAQHALLITSLILGGAGTVALILDAAGVGSVSLAPRASPTSAGLDLHLTF